MSEVSVQLADHTFNPWRLGPGGVRVVAAEPRWREPLKWSRQAAKDGVRRKVLCALLADVFEDWHGPMVGPRGDRLFHDSASSPWRELGAGREVMMSDVRQRLIRLVDNTEHLDWLFLTKRPENITRMLDEVSSAPFVIHDPNAGPRQQRWVTHKELGVRFDRLWPNLWLGTSVEDQASADERIPHLLATPVKARFLVVEPMLGPVDLHGPAWEGRARGMESVGVARQLSAEIASTFRPLDGIHWVIIGGESGPDARPCNVEWVRSLVRQCKAAGVACFVKQLGADPRAWKPCSPEYPTDGDVYPLNLRDPKGAEPSEWPLELRVRQFPEMQP